INDNEAGRSGGGIHINQSRVTLNGCTIQGNEALGIGTGAGGGGGGIFIGGLNTLLVIQSGTLIDDNTAYIGGGIRILGHGSNVGQNNRYGIIMHGGTISNNTATATNTANHGGGGVAVQSMFSGAWDYVVFGMYGGYIIGNVSYRGGGINVNYNAETIIGDGTISGNIARQGGGIYVYSSRSAMEFLPHPPWTINRPRAVRILGGTITNNQATTTPTAQYTPREVNPTTGAVITPGIYNGSGGGIYVVMGSGAQISNASITNNHAHEMGGGIFTELYQYYVATLTESDVYTNLVIANTTTFEDNTAGQGDFLPPTNAYDWTNIPGQAQGGSQSIHNHPINNYDINFRREAVTTIPFTFHKTTSNVYTTPNLVNIADITPFLLEGAYFSLFRFEGTGTPPTTVIYPSADWERVYYDVRSTGLLANPITMEITPDGIYHLVEILAPSGFQTPFGQWRITHDDNAPGEFVIFAVGGSAPSFEYLDGFFYVGNIPDFELPLTGRTGHNLILWAGSLALLAGFGMWAYLNFFAGKKGEKYNNQII
ncbi:MAG: hypothetical protein FWC73_14315, partial [Defluviitaleaceae bacterium]|nr:hypothetical protein [Defluviitaleaceae bacterium]